MKFDDRRNLKSACIKVFFFSFVKNNLIPTNADASASRIRFSCVSTPFNQLTNMCLLL
jgi:hypothetical protein